MSEMVQTCVALVFVLKEQCIWLLVCNDTPVYRYIAIFFATMQISYIEQAIAIFTVHLHVNQQTWESTVFN